MNYLERLDIHPKVRSFFEPYYSNKKNTILFHYGNDVEHAGPGFHRIPITESHWAAGEPALATHYMISASAMDAIAWLNQHHTRYRDIDNLCFIAVGAVPFVTHAETIKQRAHHQKIHFLFSNNSLGVLCDLKLAAWIRNKPLKIHYQEQHYQLQFEQQNYTLPKPSLNALEKASRYNFRIRTHKAKKDITHYQQLLSTA